ncbi:MAG TPA: hypothetical protein VHG29_08340 [Novosphingobium sp.]|nr:hypothetical protein [Novosphingobium sp.]
MAKGVTYDCDTAAGHFSELSLPASPAFTVSGHLQILNLAQSKQYAPLARLTVSNATDVVGPSSEGWAGFEFMNLPGNKGLSTGFLESTSLAKGGTKQNTVLGIASSRDVAFSLTFSGNSVRMNIDGHENSIPFNADRPIVRISCSTGEFLFYDMEIVPTR